MITEEQWNADTAAEIVCPMRDTETGKIAGIAIVDPAMPADDPPLVIEDKFLARAIAVRLVEIAALLPEPPRILRRDPDADDHLQALGDV